MKLKHQSPWLTHAVGLTATLLLHGLFLQSLTLGSVAAKRAPEQDVGPGASSILSSDGSWMSLVIVHLPGPSESQMTEDVSSRGEAEWNPVIQIASPDPRPPAPIEEEMIDDSGEAAHTAGDPAMQSMLFGRYTGQIDARIQRAWRKPRGPISDVRVQQGDAGKRKHEEFRCQVRIAQDGVGHVKEIELVQCNGTAEWQVSLVRAIQRASPLPAPPHPSVFTNVLTLAFNAKEYTPGYRDDEYEHAAAGSIARVESSDRSL